MMDLKERSQTAEMQYADTGNSGKETDEEFKLNDILPKLKKFSVRKPLAYIVGSLVTKGVSENDIDLVVRGEDWSEDQRIAFDFRLLRQMSDILDIPYQDIDKYVSIHYTNTGPFTDAVPIYEDTILPINNPEITKMHLRGNIEVIEKSDGRRIIAGYASVTIIDDENQMIPEETLKNGIESLMEDESYSNLMLKHKNIQIGKILKNYKDFETHVDDNGLFIVAEVRKDLEISDKVWEQIENKEISGFSISGEILSKKEECDETKCWEVIDRANFFEVSVCEEPINKASGFQIVHKCNVCKMLDKNNNEKMTEKEKNADESEDEKVENEEPEGLVGALKEKVDSMMNKESFDKDDLEEIKSMVDQLSGKGKNPDSNPSEYPYPTEYPYPSKSNDEELDWHGVIANAIDDIWMEIKAEDEEDEEENEEETEDEDEEDEEEKSKDEETEDENAEKSEDSEEVEESKEELETAIKARDEALEGYEKKIEELENKVEKLEKTEKKPKTVKENEEPESKDSGIVFDHGKIYKE